MPEITDQFASECLHILRRWENPVAGMRVVLEFARREPSAEVTDAAVEALAVELRKIWMGPFDYVPFELCGTASQHGWRNVARHVLTARRPKRHATSSFESLRLLFWNRGIHGERAADWARDVLALCDTLPEDTAACIRRLTLRVNELRSELLTLEHDKITLSDRLATTLSQGNAYKGDLDISNARIATLEAELNAAEMSATDLKNLDAVVAILDIEDSTTTPAEAVAELHERIDRLRAELAAAKAGSISLGEGLTEAQAGWSAGTKTDVADRMVSACHALNALPGWGSMVEGYEAWLAIRDRLYDYADTLRASAAPKAEPVDWVKIAKDHMAYVGPSPGADAIMNGLCEQIAALRAKGGE